jgi:hypothetical protein
VQAEHNDKLILNIVEAPLTLQHVAKVQKSLLIATLILQFSIAWPKIKKISQPIPDKTSEVRILGEKQKNR